MSNLLLRIIGSALTVALIATATRWLYGASGAQLPKSSGNATVYEIKWQWRALGVAGGLFWILFSIWSWYEYHSRPDGLLIAITVASVVIGIWISNGTVRTDAIGITKTTLLRSRSFQWKDITGIRYRSGQGGAIELESRTQKLVIDSRFVAFHHLLGDIEGHARMRATTTT